MNAPREKTRPAEVVGVEASVSTPRRGSKVFAIAPGPSVGADKSDPRIEEEADFTQIPVLAPEAPGASPRAGSGWLAGLFWSALGVLLTFYLLDAGWDLILRLGTKNPVLGQIAFGLAGFAAITLLFYLGRELYAILRMRRVHHLRIAAQAARTSLSREDATRVLRLLQDFYASDPTTAAGRARIKRAEDDVLDPQTRLDLAERALLAPKDEEARTLIAGAAQRVSMVTALSPRAMVDIIFVAAQSILMIRKLSTLYGGRAGGVGLWRLTARILAHLAVTGGVAMADSVVGQVLGAGLVARLSAKLGEGVLNGILTARVGIAALEYCRPMEFVACQPMILSEVVKSIVTREKVEEKPAV